MASAVDDGGPRVIGSKSKGVIGMGNISLGVNLVLGLAITAAGVLCCMDHPYVHFLTRGALALGQRTFGEDFNIHPAIVGSAMTILGLFTLFVAFTIFAKGHDWWVVQWMRESP